MSLNISVRPVQKADDTFLYELYATTRADELQAWGWNPAQAAVFLNLQFTAQQRHYTFQYPDGTHQIISLDDQPAGQWLVNHSKETIRLVDISLLPAYRNRGIGTELLQGLLTEANANGQIVQLEVLVANPAQHLYHKLGFRQTHTADFGSNELYLQMEYLPAFSGLNNR